MPKRRKIGPFFRSEKNIYSNENIQGWIAVRIPFPSPWNINIAKLKRFLRICFFCFIIRVILNKDSTNKSILELESQKQRMVRSHFICCVIILSGVEIAARCF